MSDSSDGQEFSFAQVAASALEYHALGWVPIPEIDLRPEKEIRRPAIRDYGTKVWPSSQILEAAFNKVYNLRDKDPETRLVGASLYEGRCNGVGVLLGAASGGLIDIDLDNRLAVDLAPLFLPPTRVFGRASNPGSHWIYQDRNLTKEKEQKVHHRRVEVELRCGAGNQIKTTFPPSLNNGELVKWENDAAIREVAIEELLPRVHYLAAATLIAMLWVDGSRTALATAISGAIARSVNDDVQSGERDEEWGMKTIHYWDRVIRTIAEIQNDRSIGKRLLPAKAYTDLQESLRMKENGDETGPKIQGVKSLINCIGKEDAALLVQWMGLKDAQKAQRAERQSSGGGGDNGYTADTIERLYDFNGQYAVVKIGASVRIVDTTTMNLGEAMGRKAFGELHERIPVAWMEVNDKVRPLNFVNAWMSWPERRTYMGVVFDPLLAHDANPEVLNLWSGWGVEPAPGDCSLYLEHIRKVIANGDERIYQWIISWMADFVQYPTRRVGTCIVLRGDQGTGKGSFIQPLLRIAGKAGLHLHDAQRIAGRFNSPLANRMFVFADEAWWAGDKKHEGILKAVITEKTLEIEYKGMEPVTMNNYIRFAMATNNDWAIPAGINERRFAVFDVNNEVRQDRKYFEAMHRQMIKGGDQALLHYLLHEVDLKKLKADGIDPAVVPRTEALAEQKQRSVGSAMAWLIDAADDGTVELFNGPGAPESVELWGLEWLRTKDIYEKGYLPWCKLHGIRPENNVTFGKLLTRYGFTVRKSNKKPGYVPPPQWQVRAQLTTELGVDFDDPESESGDSGSGIGWVDIPSDIPF